MVVTIVIRFGRAQGLVHNYARLFSELAYLFEKLHFKLFGTQLIHYDLGTWVWRCPCGLRLISNLNAAIWWLCVLAVTGLR